MGDEAAQAAKDHRHVRAEDPPSNMRLVDHDERQAKQEVRPSWVPRQDRGVEHVRVRQDQIRVAADEGTFGLRRVAVVDGRADLGELQLADLPQLVARERLRREQVQGGPLLVGDGGAREREVVHEGLPRGRSGREHHVRPAVQEIIACPAKQGVVTCPAEECIVAGMWVVSNEDVAEYIGENSGVS